MHVLLYFFFFFSSRRRHTRFDCDWSSDVCSSDLARLHLSELRLEQAGGAGKDVVGRRGGEHDEIDAFGADAGGVQRAPAGLRSEERRVGKEGRSRWSPYH